jgi:replication initiation protein RepC
MVLEACPEISDFAQAPINTWRDFCSTAAYIRPFLGISPSGWEEAVEVLGLKDAAIVVAAINQRMPAITSPGGYLRSLTQKSREGRFSITPMILALIRTNQRKTGKLQPSHQNMKVTVPADSGKLGLRFSKIRDRGHIT